MGFYGNITNTNRTQFVFDKIYPNRKAMDQGLIDGDGVFIGRYVLVDYHEGTLPADSYARLYYNNENNCFYFSDDFAFTSMVEYTEEPYYLEDGSINEKRFDPAYNHNIFANEIFYVLNPAGVQTFYIASGKTIKYGYDVNGKYTSKNTILATKITAPADSDIYFKNYAEDRAEYPEMKNGYDSTVWQKVYTDDEEKYVNIAELNSVVPTFGLTVDAPTINPIKPHFDADSTNVYYRLHVQPAAGIRIADSEEKWGVYEGHGSDETVSSYEYNWDPEAQEKKPVGKTGYKGAIYYNSDGFKSDYRYKKNDKKDKIAFGLTGSSGARYNTNHGAGTSVSAVKSPDIYELAINLPSIGNTMSEVWDLVYGTGKLIDNEKDAPANIEKTYQRNTNIDWNNIAGERLVREKIDGSGFEYNTDQVNTIAGCINSVHDLMGMIITQESQKQSESDEEYKERISIDNSLTNRIYYGNYEPTRKIGSEPYKGYYIKNLTYEIKEGKEDVYEPVTLKDFFANNYYYIDNSNYYLETYGYRAGNKYYSLDNRIFNKEDLYEKDWEKNKYYYLKDGDYVIDGNTWPDADIQYFDITPGYKDVVDSDVYKFFFPTTEEYFNAYFKDVRSEKDKDGKAYGNGLFYYDNDDKLYKPFYVGLPYTQTLYWWRNYMVETSTDITGKPVEVYDFEKGAVCDTYTMYDLTDAETKYYWLNPETDNYELITNELELIERDENGEIVPISKKYSTFKVESIVEIPGDFYEPDEYYYKEGNDYILAREEKRAKDLDSYFVIDHPSQAVTDTFYEPNKYHLKIDENNYVLDTDEFNEDGEYYLIHYLHVKEDPDGVFAPGTKINKHIELSDFPDLKYGPIYEKYEWKELVGFGRTLNTINGLILDLNNLIKTNDTLTRDRKTIQGCINSINDILDSVYELIPDYFIAVDKYGRMTSMKPIGDDWIQVDVNKEDNGKVIITHIGPVEKDARNENNETPAFGSTFEIEDWVFDDKGHQTNKSVHTVKIPQGSLSDKTKTGSDIITQLSFVPNTGALTSTRENLSSIKLADYVKDSDNSDVTATDTLGQALSKLQTQIIEEEEARAAIIDALDMNNEDTAHFISKITQTDGKVSVVRAAAGTLKIADVDGSYSVPETSSSIEKEDTLATAFGKIEAQINTANKTRENDITILTEKVNTEIQDRKDAIAKEVNDRDAAILVETNARTNAINGLNNTINGLNANISTETSEVITAITQTAGLVSASKEKVGNLTLTGWALGEVDADNIPIADTDTIFNAFVKTQRQINANKKALDLLNEDSSKVNSVNYKIENALTNYNLTNLAERVDNLEQAVPAEKIAIWDGVANDYVSKAVYDEALNKIQNLEGRIAALEALIIPPEEPPTETEPDNEIEEP